MRHEIIILDAIVFQGFALGGRRGVALERSIDFLD